ncbi:hypothetical protein JTE90_023586 [Oedothorax gibbosus]|uniref:Uncharacterized protein n=1 Tax=Oedothorax gibbosus TaxID=931172 RepID=A0AAV6TI08_9ARAC|nr:hypothetical protein JTE90_023586 [Oedothorax gibbosus]
MGPSVLRYRRNPFRSETSAQTQTHARVVSLPTERNGVNSPQPGHGRWSFGPSAVTQPNSETSTEDPGKVYLFLCKKFVSPDRLVRR